MKFITGSCRNQTYFTTLEEQIAKDNPVLLIDAFVERLDLSAMGLVCTITEKQKKQNHNMGGAPKFAPHLFLKLYLFGYLHKIRSSHKLVKRILAIIKTNTPYKKNHTLTIDEALTKQIAQQQIDKLEL
jgi:transposase